MKKINKLLGALYTGNKAQAESTIDSILKDKANLSLDVKKVAVASEIFNERAIDEGVVGDVKKKMAAKTLKRLNGEEEKLRAALKELEKPMFRVNDNRKRAGKERLNYKEIYLEKEKVKAKIAEIKKKKQKIKDKFPNLKPAKG